MGWRRFGFRLISNRFNLVRFRFRSGLVFVRTGFGLESVWKRSRVVSGWTGFGIAFFSSRDGYGLDRLGFGFGLGLGLGLGSGLGSGLDLVWFGFGVVWMWYGFGLVQVWFGWIWVGFDLSLVLIGLASCFCFSVFGFLLLFFAHVFVVGPWFLDWRSIRSGCGLVCDQGKYNEPHFCTKAGNSHSENFVKWPKHFLYACSDSVRGVLSSALVRSQLARNPRAHLQEFFLKTLPN